MKATQFRKWATQVLKTFTIHCAGIDLQKTEFIGVNYGEIDNEITVKTINHEDFISDWLRNRNTTEFLGVWESMYNPDFNYGEFAIIKSNAGLNSYKISVKEWCVKTNAIGIKATTGRYGGTYAQSDIAYEFAYWISVGGGK